MAGGDCRMLVANWARGTVGGLTTPGSGILATSQIASAKGEDGCIENDAKL